MDKKKKLKLLENITESNAKELGNVVIVIMLLQWQDNIFRPCS